MKAATIFRSGVLQLRVDQVDILHYRVIGPEVHYFNILQDSIRALFILQARALSAIVLQLGEKGGSGIYGSKIDSGKCI